MPATSSPATAEWVSIAHAAAQLSLSTKTVRRLISSGELPARRIGSRTIRVDAAALAALGRPLSVPPQKP